MKIVTLKIPADKYEFYMELFNQLRLEVSDDDIVIPEWQKEIVLDRVKKKQKGRFNSVGGSSKAIQI
jgi:signal transduction histidine kinase